MRLVRGVYVGPCTFSASSNLPRRVRLSLEALIVSSLPFRGVVDFTASRESLRRWMTIQGRKSGEHTSTRVSAVAVKGHDTNGLHLWCNVCHYSMAMSA